MGAHPIKNDHTEPMHEANQLIDRDERVLITGSNGFIGSRVVYTLLRHGFSNLRCFVRPSSNLSGLNEIIAAAPWARVDVMAGNLLSPEDCARATEDVAVILHLAAGMEKSFPGSFMSSVVTTKNLLEAALRPGSLRRFVNVSSFAVYSNWNISAGRVLDETCELESHAEERHEAYAYAKLKQEQLVAELARNAGLPYVIVRPGAVYGPGKSDLTARVGIDTFGVFLHLGGSNKIPLTYVDNCADAIVLAGLKPGIDGEAFNVVDDDLPSSRKFLRMYKRHGKRFKSLYIPYALFYGFCWMWETYSRWSRGQLPPVFNRRRCATYWKGNKYSNQKLKTKLGWVPATAFPEGAARYFEYVRKLS